MTAKERAQKMLEEWASMKVADLPEFFERHLREHAYESKWQAVEQFAELNQDISRILAKYSLPTLPEAP
jgi:hypothetical protein